jgi:signal transduction histidine kinase
MYLVNTGFKKEDTARVDQGWEIVERNVTRIRGMVSDILYYAKPREPNWELLSLKQVLEDVAGLVRTKVEEQNIVFNVESDLDGGEFEADKQALRSLLINLLENSFDACRIDSRKEAHIVNIKSRGYPDSVELIVEDNGIGMDQETSDKAFSLFFSSKGSEGTGLGLFISNRIALSHGGKITLESESGEGTRFIVRLPRVRPVEDLQPN